MPDASLTRQTLPVRAQFLEMQYAPCKAIRQQQMDSRVTASQSVERRDGRARMSACRVSVPAELHSALRSGEGYLWSAVSISRQQNEANCR